MAVSSKNAYKSSLIDNSSAFSILIGCDFDFFKYRYCLADINYKINHKAYIKAVSANDARVLNQYFNI